MAKVIVNSSKDFDKKSTNNMQDMNDILRDILRRHELLLEKQNKELEKLAGDRQIDKEIKELQKKNLELTIESRRKARRDAEKQEARKIREDSGKEYEGGWKPTADLMATMALGPIGLLATRTETGRRITRGARNFAANSIKKIASWGWNKTKSDSTGAVARTKNPKSNVLNGAIEADNREEAAAPMNKLNATVKKGFNNVLKAIGGQPITKEEKDKKSWISKILGWAAKALGGFGKFLWHALGLSKLFGLLKKGTGKIFGKALGWILAGIGWILNPFKRLGARILAKMGLTALWAGIASATKKGFSKVMDWLGFGGGKPKFDARAGRYRDPKTGRFVSASTAKATGKDASKGAAKAGAKTATKNTVKRTTGKTIAKTIGKGVLGGIAGLGLGIGGDLIHEYGSAGLQRLGMGEKAATNVSNYAGSALKGAAWGSLFGPVGALVGGAIGLAAQAGKDIYDNYKTNKVEKEAQQAAAHTTGNYNTASNEGSVSQISREETNAHLKNIIAALNKMNSNLSPDVQHELDRQYLREMSGYMPAPESAWDSSPMGISKNIFAQSPMIK